MDAIVYHPQQRRKDPQSALPGEGQARQLRPSSVAPDDSQRPSGYGLPCSKCRLYYPANLDICPTCHNKERVAPKVPGNRPKSTPATAAPVPNPDTLEREREEFLRQFKSQMLAEKTHAISSAAAACNLAEHQSGPETAEICKPCYDRLQERLDVCEAALHMDLKEASQIVYDAVWADSSDPSKTYQNAASALLAELRKRSGVTTLLGPFQPLPH